MSDQLNTIIATFDKFQMSSYTVGPIYSAWLFRVNNTLINLVSKQVKFPNGDGVEHMPWDQDLTDDVRRDVANWIGVRNNIIDAIESLDGGYPPSTFEDTYDYLLRNNPEDNEKQIKQNYAMEYIARVKRGEKLFSTIQQFVEDNYTQEVKQYNNLRDTRDHVVKYLENASYVKDRSDSLDFGNLPEWFHDMVYTVSSNKFAASYAKKLTLLDRSLSPTTRKAIETEIFLMEQVAEDLAFDLPQSKPASDNPIDSAYLASLGIVNAA